MKHTITLHCAYIADTAKGHLVRCRIAGQARPTAQSFSTVEAQKACDLAVIAYMRKCYPGAAYTLKELPEPARHTSYWREPADWAFEATVDAPESLPLLKPPSAITLPLLYQYEETPKDQ
jgi:hypothetical protein